MNNLNLETREMEGICSSEALNSNNHIVEMDGLTWNDLPIPLLLNHDKSAAGVIGEVTKLWKVDDKLHIKCRVFKNTGIDEIEKSWLDIQNNILKEFSISFFGKYWKKAAKTNGFETYVEANIREVSICPRGANPDSKVDDTNKALLKKAKKMLNRPNDFYKTKIVNNSLLPDSPGNSNIQIAVEGVESILDVFKLEEMVEILEIVTTRVESMAQPVFKSSKKKPCEIKRDATVSRAKRFLRNHTPKDPIKTERKYLDVMAKKAKHLKNDRLNIAEQKRYAAMVEQAERISE